MPDNTVISLPRYLLDELFPNNPRAVLAFESLGEAAEQSSADSGAAVAATSGLQNASFLTLSANDILSNERVLRQGDGISVTIGAADVRVGVDGTVARKSGVGGLVFTVSGSSTIAVPNTGTLATLSEVETLANKTLQSPRVSVIGDYADDAAAAAGGVPLTGVYRTGSVLKVRVT